MKKSLQALHANLTHVLVITIAILLMTIVFSKAFAQEAEAEFEVPDAPDETLYASNTDVSQKQSNKLWIAYAKWTNRVMLCLTDEDPSDYSIKRLLRNQDKVDEAMEIFYSDNFGRKLSELLYAHKAIAAEIRRASASGDNDAHADALEQLRINKKEVIEFIQEASPLYTVAQSER